MRQGQSLILVRGDRAEYLPLFPLSTFVLGLHGEGVYFLRELRWADLERGRRLKRATYVAYSSTLNEQEERPGDRAANAIEHHVRSLEHRLGPGPVGPAAPIDLRSYQISEVTEEKASHLRNFVGRDGVLASVEKWMHRTSSGYLLLTGPPGQGKSAFSACLAETHADTILHMVKTHPNPLRFVPALIAQAARIAGTTLKPESFVGSSSDLRNTLVQCLQRLVETRGRAFVVIDALDELAEPFLTRPKFLPSRLPDRAHVVLSCRPYTPLVRALREHLKDLEELELAPLTIDDFRSLLARLLPAGAPARLEQALDVDALFRRLQGNALLLRRAASLMNRAWRAERMEFEGLVGNELPVELNGLFDHIYAEISERQAPSPDGNLRAVLVQALCVANAPLSFAELAELATASGHAMTVETSRHLCHGMSEYLLDTGRGRVKPWHQGLADFVRGEILGRSGVRQLEAVFCDWLASSQDSEYSLRHRASHLVAAGRHEELGRLLLSSAYWEAKVERDLGVDLLSEIELGASLEDIRSLAIPLTLMAEALRVDLPFILRHPQLLFQWIYNRLSWHDSIRSEPFHEVEAGASPPWRQGDFKVSTWCEEWLGSRNRPRDCWLEALSPPIVRLGTGQLDVLQGLSHPRSVAVTEDGRALAASDLEGWVFAVLPCGVETFRGSRPKGFDIAGFLGDAKQLVLVRIAAPPTLRVIDTATGATVHERALPDLPPRSSGVAASRDGRWLAVGGARVVLLDTETLSTVYCAEATDGLHWNPIGVTGQGRFVVAARRQHQPDVGARSSRQASMASDLVAIDTLHKTEDVLGVGGIMWDVATQIDGTLAAINSVPRSLATVDLERTGHQQSIVQDGSWVESSAFSPDGTLLASGGSSVVIRELRTGGEVARFDGHLGTVRGVAFFPDGRRLASASDDATIRERRARTTSCGGWPSTRSAGSACATRMSCA